MKPASRACSSSTLRTKIGSCSGAAIDALAEIGDVLPESLRYHEGHPASMVQGQTAAELKSPSSRVAKVEIAALWSALSRSAPLLAK